MKRNEWLRLKGCLLCSITYPRLTESGVVANLEGGVRTGLPEEGRLNRDLNEVRERVVQIFEGIAFQKEGTDCSKALRLLFALCV